MKKYKYDLSVIFPSMNEGRNVEKVLKELYEQFEKLGLNAEIIAIDAVSRDPSYSLYEEYVERKDNFTAIKLSEAKKAGSGKTMQYMIGFELAKGKYIAQIDSDGQDNPADLEKFIRKLDEGFDLVVGHKQKRKDKAFYMFTSKIGNTLTRKLTGTKVHDMNCGFKAYKAEVAKSLNLKGRWYRYIPSILASKGYKITEVPIENRKREWGKTNFSFFNRLQSGLFDMVVISAINRHRDVPMYFWGWLSLTLFAFSAISLLATLFIDASSFETLLIVLSVALMNMGFTTFVLGLMNEFRRDSQRDDFTSYPIAEIKKKD